MNETCVNNNTSLVRRKMFMKVLLFIFSVPLHNRKAFEYTESTTTTDGEDTSAFIYGKDDNISINKIHQDLIKKGVLEFLQNKNYSEIQKLMVLEKYMNDYEEKIKTTKLDEGGLWKDWDFELEK
jgi:hypothetical protein